ncbi:hypothetical protein ANCDUO_03520 [Ancylostoma duodenale]|uniref:Uncharacterized protein n=1 Tax=Ancylostoma duodenale TaxID=51022 RepID=A0A0C2DTL8_9BILA|nr:hypothetical protein ANCDUO_03520 [Ancylostoma duodenale]
MKTARRMAIRWMAPETIETFQYTQKSDVCNISKYLETWSIGWQMRSPELLSATSFLPRPQSRPHVVDFSSAFEANFN